MPALALIHMKSFWMGFTGLDAFYIKVTFLTLYAGAFSEVPGLVSLLHAHAWKQYNQQNSYNFIPYVIKGGRELKKSFCTERSINASIILKQIGVYQYIAWVHVYKMLLREYPKRLIYIYRLVHLLIYYKINQNKG